MNCMRSAVAMVAMTALMLSACQTTGDEKPPGAVVGGVAGGAYGATQGAISGGQAGGSLLGLLVGAVVGGVAGHYMLNGDNSGTYGQAERQKADEAAREILVNPSIRIVQWSSDKHSRVYGWVRHSSSGLVKVKKGCRSLKFVRFVNGLSTEEDRQYCREGDAWVGS